jgi:predicted negative regulator of RcsB-dependent stress response
MATQLDLQEQEQLDALKSFWKQYGNLITWVLILVLGAYAAWNGWNWYQRDQAFKAGSMYDALEQAAQANDADKAARIFEDLKTRFPATAQAGQGGLVAARLHVDKAQADKAQTVLTWVAEHAKDPGYRQVARMRLAALAAEAKQYDQALKHLDAAQGGDFEALVADRRGDVLSAAGKPDEALKAYQAAWAGMDDKNEYRRLVEAKLTALGAAPAPAAAASAAASGAAR